MLCGSCADETPAATRVTLVTAAEASSQSAGRRRLRNRPARTAATTPASTALSAVACAADQPAPTRVAPQAPASDATLSHASHGQVNGLMTSPQASAYSDSAAATANAAGRPIGSDTVRIDEVNVPAVASAPQLHTQSRPSPR